MERLDVVLRETAFEAGDLHETWLRDDVGATKENPCEGTVEIRHKSAVVFVTAMAKR
jgi:hypothetical protein